MKQLNNKKGLALSGSKGFTLIEVVLVLAIGGLIFLLAFIAFQQVSANRRDTQRRADAGRVLAELQNARGDGMTVGSSNIVTFNTSYMKNPKGPNGDYTLTYGTSFTTTPPVPAEEILVRYNAKCSGGAITDVAGSGTYAVSVKLEKGTVCRGDDS